MAEESVEQPHAFVGPSPPRDTIEQAYADIANELCVSLRTVKAQLQQAAHWFVALQDASPNLSVAVLLGSDPST